MYWGRLHMFCRVYTKLCFIPVHTFICVRNRIFLYFSCIHTAWTHVILATLLNTAVCLPSLVMPWAAKSLSLNIHFSSNWRTLHLLPRYCASQYTNCCSSYCHRSHSILPLVRDANYVHYVFWEDWWKFWLQSLLAVGSSTAAPVLLVIMKHTA